MGKRKNVKKDPKQECLIVSSTICRTVDDLWQLLQHNSSDQLKPLLEEFDRIQDIVRRIRDLQNAASPCVTSTRTEKLPAFEKWLQDNEAVYSSSLAIMVASDTELGMKSTRDLKCDEKVLEIPEKLMLSSDTAAEGVLGGLIGGDEMLKVMPNISLALHLLNEKFTQSSFWEPYISILPNSFCLPLYFTKQELLVLQGSPCLVRCLLQIRNISKLYSHLHRIIRCTGEKSLPLFQSGFLFDDFIWAVSCVMSRQNEIPSRLDVSTPTLALIPLWDLCNHSSGCISTFYNTENSTCDCYAQRHFKSDEEFTIFYGRRTNAELFLQQGFVYPQNELDTYPIKLGLSSMEEATTRNLRMKILKSLDLPISGTFSINKSTSCPFSADLLAFVRIFTAPPNVLDKLLKSENAVALKDVKWQVNDLKSLDFLKNRCSLLLKLYTTSIDEDRECLQSAQISPCSTVAIQMRICEKSILSDALNYAKKKFEELNVVIVE